MRAVVAVVLGVIQQQRGIHIVARRLVLVVAVIDRVGHLVRQPLGLPGPLGTALLGHPFWNMVDPEYRKAHPMTDLEFERYRQVREACLVAALAKDGNENARLGELAAFLRFLSGMYDQAARAATSL